MLGWRVWGIGGCGGGGRGVAERLLCSPLGGGEFIAMSSSDSVRGEERSHAGPLLRATGDPVRARQPERGKKGKEERSQTLPLRQEMKMLS